MSDPETCEVAQPQRLQADEGRQVDVRIEARRGPRRYGGRRPRRAGARLQVGPASQEVGGQFLRWQAEAGLLLGVRADERQAAIWTGAFGQRGELVADHGDLLVQGREVLACRGGGGAGAGRPRRDWRRRSVTPARDEVSRRPGGW